MPPTERKGPDVPDGFDLRPDGTILLHVDNDRWRLRRPKLGEFRKLREALQERDDQALRLTSARVASLPDKLPDDASQADKEERAVSVKQASRDFEESIRSLNVAWLANALTMLADSTPPEPDDWPSGADEPDTIAQIVQHWRSVPLRSGGG